jgi:NAD(P)H dehydrogenase (quinone)
MSSKPKVLVMGATGQVGRAVASLLSRNPNLDTVAAARTPAKAAHLGVPVVHLDLDKIETFAPALKGVDRVFMATGYTVDMLRQSKDLVNMARRAGVAQIAHLGACGDDDTPLFQIQIEGGKLHGSGLQIDLTGHEGDLKV